MLFDELPANCLVLLEDVDSAGLVDRATRRANAVSSPVHPGGAFDTGHDPMGIYLSGLLNVIDGIASQEGRVLVMTTNRVDTLDSALLRPGRVDMRIRFELATSKQAGDLFMRTYVNDKPTPDQVIKEDKETLGNDELKEMALAFSSEVPDLTLSPAEIQGFLMNWKKEPREALARAKQWVEDTIEEKRGQAAAKLERGIAPSPTTLSPMT